MSVAPGSGTQGPVQSRTPQDGWRRRPDRRVRSRGRLGRPLPPGRDADAPGLRSRRPGRLPGNQRNGHPERRRVPASGEVAEVKVRRLRGAASIELKPQNQSEPALDLPHESPGNLPGTVGEVVLVHRQQLGDVRDRVLGEAGARSLKQHVAGSVEEPRIRREGHADYGSEPASVECVRLDDEDGAPKAGPGFARLVQVRPPYFPACDYQSSATERACARRICGSIPLGESA